MKTNYPIDSFDEDLACFAIWEQGLSEEAKIIQDLEKNFEVLGVFHIYWSKQHYNRNIARLYESSELTHAFYKYNKKIGKPPFCFIVVRDKTPVYTHMRTVSGAIEAVNKNIIDRKNEYRTWFEKPYQIHSSCNFSEFSSQATLILGLQTLETTLQGEHQGSVIELRKDLEGAEGWRSWNELFSILNYCSNYLILRDFEAILSQQPIEELEFLCDNYQSLASTANIQQDQSSPFRGTLVVSEQVKHINIRFVGDGYFANSWEKDLLNRRSMNQRVYTPCTEDFFFSLLYYTRVYQKQPNEYYEQTLRELAEVLSFDWFPSDKVSDDKYFAAILSGYMRAKKYYYEQPFDSMLKVNPSVIAGLPTLKDIGMNATEQRRKRWKSIIKRLKHKLRDSFKRNQLD